MSIFRDGRSLFDVPTSTAPIPLSTPSFDWNDDQVRAVEAVVVWRRDRRAPRLLKLTGPGGAGKTAVTREIRRRLLGTCTAWSGMTGKAALRLRAAVGVRTTTAHSALYHPPREVDNPEEAKIDLRFDAVRSGSPDDALLVIDEASMIGPRFRVDLDRSPYEKILLVGDPYQLAPVLSRAEEEDNGGEDYSVFAEMPGPHLPRVMRNGGAVLAAATIVREQHRILTDSTVDGSRYDYVDVRDPSDVVTAAVDAWVLDRADHVLLAWRNETRMLVNAVCRHRLGLDGDLPHPGEPLVVRKNVHRKGLMNGDVVRCEQVLDDGPMLAGVPTRWFIVCDDVTGRRVEVLAPVGDFSGVTPYVGLEVWRRALREACVDDVCPLTFAYCLTAHLAQGSQYRRVSVVMPGDLRSSNFTKSTKLPDGTTMPFSMRWTYTAFSRAIDHLTLYVAR